MTTQHTPAPWHFIGDSLTHRQFDIYAPTQAPQQHVCTVNNLSAEKLAARDASVALANARLIAAAPELLAALEMVDRIWRHDQTANISPDSPLAIVRAAIAKATGETL